MNELLQRYIKGDISEEDKKKVIEWLDESPDNIIFPEFPNAYGPENTVPPIVSSSISGETENMPFFFPSTAIGIFTPIPRLFSRSAETDTHGCTKRL